MFRADQIGIYLHWPFCAARCPYCDFNAHIREHIDQATWVAGYVRALEYYAQHAHGRSVVSVFFGGGTPSLMSAQSVATIIDAIQRLFKTANDIEISLEANPTSIETDKLRGFKDAGVNRISMGVQSLNDADLGFLGRNHSAADAMRAIDVTRRIFDRYSFDLIYARPDQSMQAWEDELRRAIPLANGHMSLYQLTIERNTPFYMRHARKDFTIPDDVQGAEFYHLTQDVMSAAGLPAYEVSNHAAVGQECRHNQIYWDAADYIGIGAGAHGRYMSADGARIATRDHAAPEIWLERVNAQGHGAHPAEILAGEDILTEALMMGLRRVDGVDLAAVEERSGVTFLDHIDMNNIATAQAQGWLVYNPDAQRLYLTREGMLRLNAILPFILK